jgi:hypothetical protein
MDVVRTKVEEYSGLDLKTGRVFMNGGAARVSRNFDYSRAFGCRVRPGYANMLGGPEVVTSQATDDFNRANGALGANWTLANDSDITGDVEVISNEVGVTGASGGPTFCMQYTGVSFPKSQYSKIKIAAKETAINDRSRVGVFVRMTGDSFYNFTGTPGAQAQFWYIRYFSGWDSTNKLYTISKVVAFGYDGSPPDVGDTIELRAVGNVLSAYINGESVLSGTDNSLSGGTPGFQMHGKTTGGLPVASPDERLDDWEGGLVSQGAVTVPAAASGMAAFERDDDTGKIIIAHSGSMTETDRGRPEWTS